MDKNNFQYTQSSDKIACNVNITYESLCHNSKISCNIQCINNECKRAVCCSCYSSMQLNLLLVVLDDCRHYEVELIVI